MDGKSHDRESQAEELGKTESLLGPFGLCAGEFVVPELLQHDATPENLAQALYNALNDSVLRARLPQRFSAIHRQLKCNTAEQAAKAVLPMLSRAAA